MYVWMDLWDVWNGVPALELENIVSYSLDAAGIALFLLGPDSFVACC